MRKCRADRNRQHSSGPRCCPADALKLKSLAVRPQRLSVLKNIHRIPDTQNAQAVILCVICALAEVSAGSLEKTRVYMLKNMRASKFAPTHLGAKTKTRRPDPARPARPGPAQRHPAPRHPAPGTPAPLHAGTPAPRWGTFKADIRYPSRAEILTNETRQPFNWTQISREPWSQKERHRLKY